MSISPAHYTTGYGSGGRRGPGNRPPAGLARFSPLAAWAMLATAISYVLAFKPPDRQADALGGCGWYAMFGTNGPTCGGTRMVWYLLHGDLVNAARMHLRLRWWAYLDHMQAGIGL